MREFELMHIYGFMDVRHNQKTRNKIHNQNLGVKKWFLQYQEQEVIGMHDKQLAN